LLSSYKNFYSATNTLDTTRIMGDNPIEFNINATKTAYPSTDVEWRPNAVILVPLTTYHYGLLASPIIHFPVNAPLLFTNPFRLSTGILAEIKRLSPTGLNVPAKVIIVGPICPAVEMQLRNAGLSTIRVIGRDPVDTAGEALEFRYKVASKTSEGSDNIMIVPADSPTGCLHAAYFTAHMGVPILFSYEDRLPEATRGKLIKYNDKNVFVIAGKHLISDEVLNEIRGLVKGKVDRIGGSTPYECAVNFTKYYSPEGDFGWNINTRDGWSFCFGVPEDWVHVLSASIFAHIGKHSPILFIEPDNVPNVTKNYVLSLNPPEQHPPKPPFMHGFILGGYSKITHRAQVELEKILIKGAGENGMHH